MTTLQIIYEINHIIDLRVISDELILAGKLQKKLQKKKPEKNSGFDELGALPTELRSHMLGARQILVGPFFPVKEFLSQIICEINHIIDLRVISDELILAGKLQLKKLQKKIRRGLNPCLPDTSWALYQLSYD